MQRGEKVPVVVTEKTAPEAENVTVATVTEAGTVVENPIRKNDDAGTGDAGKSIYAFALRANLLRWATLTPDLGIEWRINRHVGILVNGSWTFVVGTTRTAATRYGKYRRKYAII